MNATLYQGPAHRVKAIPMNTDNQDNSASGETPGLLACHEPIRFDGDSHTQADLHLAPFDPHDPAITLEADGVVRGQPPQKQRQPDLLAQDKVPIRLEKHAREAHIPGYAGPPLQFHGNGDREARVPAPLVELGGTLGGEPTHTRVPPSGLGQCGERHPAIYSSSEFPQPRSRAGVAPSHRACDECMLGTDG